MISCANVVLLSKLRKCLCQKRPKIPKCLCQKRPKIPKLFADAEDTANRLSDIYILNDTNMVEF